MYLPAGFRRLPGTHQAVTLTKHAAECLAPLHLFVDRLRDLLWALGKTSRDGYVNS